MFIDIIVFNLCFQKFLQKVEELFTCICCQEIVFKPVTTECSHNVCKVSINSSQSFRNRKIIIYFVDVKNNVTPINAILSSLQSCITRSFKADVYCCPLCRTDLGKDYKMPVNSTLQDILKKFFPGYESGRL